MSRIGVLGGTFDPPHYGHLVLAEQARDQLHLERVLWVPAANPPHKEGLVHTPVVNRLEMLRLALEDNPRFEISLVDVERPGPHYSVDMLSILQQQNTATRLLFLVGSDSLWDLPTWHEPARLASLANLVVMRRPGSPLKFEALEGTIPGIRETLIWLDSPQIEISASDIRKRIREGRSIRYLVVEAVRQYIDHHSLYRAAG